MKRIALLTLALGLFSIPAVAERAVTEGVPLMKGELTALPGTPVAIRPPVAPPATPRSVPLMKGNLHTLPGTPIPIETPRLPAPRK